MLFAVNKDEKWGYEDKDGNMKIDYIYDYATEFNIYGFAGVKKDGKWGVIDKEGKEICEFKFEFEDEEENVKPEFIGRYYKAFDDNNGVYYTDEM